MRSLGNGKGVGNTLRSSQARLSDLDQGIGSGKLSVAEIYTPSLRPGTRAVLDERNSTCPIRRRT